VNTYKVLSALLTYPSDDLIASLPEMKAVLDAEGLLPAHDRAELQRLFTELADLDIYDLQARYVELFDQYRALSLHLFEHVHGESRDRGQAMVSLLERYRETGLDLRANELPDFLPVFLEYLSELPAEEARMELAEPVAVISTLSRRLAKRESSYAAVLAALEHLAQAAPAQADLDELAQEEAEDTATTQALDAEWQEEPVDFSRREASLVGRQRARSLGAALRKER
jgi:nitrate reductase molybdenum cofactor assembly chaperone NarJ/NarW